MTVEFRADEIGEAIVDLVRDNLVTALGLKLYRQGGFSALPSPDEMDDYLNAVIVMFQGWTGCEPGPIQQYTTLTYKYKIWFLRRNNEGENSDREMSKALSKIGELFPNAHWIGGDDVIAVGTGIYRATPTECDADNPIGAWANQPPYQFSSGCIDVEVVAFHAPS